VKAKCIVLDAMFFGGSLKFAWLVILTVSAWAIAERDIEAITTKILFINMLPMFRTVKETGRQSSSPVGCESGRKHSRNQYRSFSGDATPEISSGSGIITPKANQRRGGEPGGEPGHRRRTGTPIFQRGELGHRTNKDTHLS